MLIDPMLGGAVSFFLVFLYVYVNFVRESVSKNEDDEDESSFPIFNKHSISPEDQFLMRRRTSLSNARDEISPHNLPRPGGGTSSSSVIFIFKSLRLPPKLALKPAT